MMKEVQAAVSGYATMMQLLNHLGLDHIFTLNQSAILHVWTANIANLKNVLKCCMWTTDAIPNKKVEMMVLLHRLNQSGSLQAYVAVQMRPLVSLNSRAKMTKCIMTMQL